MVGDLVLEPGEFKIRLQAHEGALAGALRTNDMVAVLDDHVTPALRAEGMARDVVRLVQSARKDADLVITDRIQLQLELPAEVETAVREHEAYVAAQVLAARVAYGAVDGSGHAFEGSTEGHDVRGTLQVIATD